MVRKENKQKQANNMQGTSSGTKPDNAQERKGNGQFTQPPKKDPKAIPILKWPITGLDDDLDGLNKIEYLEDIEAYRREIADYKGDKPKLYALIMQYLSDESRGALKAYIDQKNPAMSKTDEAKDIFSKLDNSRYAEFKMTYLNNLQLKACKPPEDLNVIFTLANTYVKPKTVTGGGLGSTFATTVDTVDKSRRRRGSRGNTKQDGQWGVEDKQLETGSNVLSGSESSSTKK